MLQLGISIGYNLRKILRGGRSGSAGAAERLWARYTRCCILFMKLHVELFSEMVRMVGQIC